MFQIKNLLKVALLLVLLQLSTSQTYDCSSVQDCSTQDYLKDEPVCGVQYHENSSFLQQKKMTFRNKCIACSQRYPHTQFFAEGKCDNYYNEFLCDPKLKDQDICTYEYFQVCGWNDNTVEPSVYPNAQEYGNICSACSQKSVYKFTVGRCPTSIEQKFCPFDRSVIPCSEAETVCGYFYPDSIQCLNPPCPEFQEYNQSCQACSNHNVEYYVVGNCPQQQAKTQCHVPRPKDCTYEYIPVCGHKSSNNCVGYHCYQTYANGCDACADDTVDYHVPGECPIDNTQLTICPNERPEFCSLELNPVCGHLIDCIDGSCLKTYSNGCDACADSNVSFYLQGECQIDEF